MTDAEKLELARLLMSDAQRRKLDEAIKLIEKLLKEQSQS